MISILSHQSDISTSKFMKLAKKCGVEVQRINCDQTPINFYDKLKLILETSNSLWVRRFFYPKFPLKPKGNLMKKIENHMNSEIKEIIDYELYKFKGFILGNHKRVRVNKLNVLEEAKLLSIQIPDFIISNDYIKNSNFIRKRGDCVIKSAFEAFRYKQFATYTESINSEELNKETKFPHFIQKKVDKVFEIRSVYLDGEFFSMAIMSQGNTQTSIDYRKYDRKVPNRNTPFKLPQKIEFKLKRLMIKLDLNFGVIDLIFTKRNEYVFLEVNPVGQFDDVSRIGNFRLYFKILKKLNGNK